MTADQFTVLVITATVFTIFYEPLMKFLRARERQKRRGRRVEPEIRR